MVFFKLCICSTLLLYINSNFKISYDKKLEKIIKDKKIKEVSFFEIEDKPFEKEVISILKKKNVKINEIRTPMFLTTRKEFKEYLSRYKKPFMANFYKLIRTRLNILMSNNGKPKGNK